MALSARLLAEKVGYLTIDKLSPHLRVDALPTRSFEPGEIVPCKDALCVIKNGWVQIRHAQHKYPVKQIEAGGVFGELPLLGQTMLVTEAVAGTPGAIIATISVEAADELITSDPASVIEMVGQRLAAVEREYIRAQMQLYDSMSAVLLRLADAGNEIEGIKQEELGEEVGINHVTLYNILNELESLGLIRIQDNGITILDKAGLRRLSEE